jgi:hypothetical protein
MERVFKSNAAEGETSKPLFRWKNIGNTFHWFERKKIIKPGEIFQATEDDIPTAFRDILIKVDGSSLPNPEVPIPGAVTEYTIKPRGKSTSLFDVVNGAGKVLNEKGLTKEKAEQLLADLQA